MLQKETNVKQRWDPHGKYALIQKKKIKRNMKKWASREVAVRQIRRALGQHNVLEVKRHVG